MMEDEPIPAWPILQIEVSKHGMEFELVEIFDLLRSRLLAFDDRLSCGVARYKPLVDGIKNRAFQLMVKIHGRLSLMVLGVAVNELLVRSPIEILDLEVRD